MSLNPKKQPLLKLPGGWVSFRHSLQIGQEGRQSSQMELPGDTASFALPTPRCEHVRSRSGCELGLWRLLMHELVKYEGEPRLEG